MCDKESDLESQSLSTQEFAARTIVGRFPLATLKSRDSAAGQIFEVSFQEKILLILDKRGAKYYFPTRRKRIIKWEKITTVALARLIEYILRDLASADYEVLTVTNKQILKRPIHISR